jgi:hypothetical protein
VEVNANFLQDLHGGIMDLLHLVFSQKLIGVHSKSSLHVDAIKLEMVSVTCLKPVARKLESWEARNR